MCIKWSRSWELFYLNTPGAKPKRVICTVVISRFVEQSHVRGMRIGTIEKKSDPYWAGEDHGQWKNGNKSVSFASVLRNSRDLWTCFAVWYRCSSTWSMREWCFFPNFLGLKYIICSRYLESCFSRCLALSFWRVSRDLQTGFASCKIVSDRRGHGCFPLILLTFLDLRVPPASTWYCYYFVVFIDLFICLFFIYTFIHYHIAVRRHFDCVSKVHNKTLRRY